MRLSALKSHNRAFSKEPPLLSTRIYDLSLHNSLKTIIKFLATCMSSRICARRSAKRKILRFYRCHVRMLFGDRHLKSLTNHEGACYTSW